MDDLNNHQMILLTILVAFVTSIATGIITVALLQEAPQTVTQTVNRVVERTIERVVAGTSTPERATPTTITKEVTKEVTVFAKEDDLLVSAVEKNQPRVARIFTSAATGSAPIGIGFVVSRDGIIATTPGSLLVEGVQKAEYSIELSGKRYSAKPIDVKNIPRGLAFLMITKLSDSDQLDPATFGSKSAPKLGQTVVLLGGADGSSIFKTTISRLVYETTSGATATSTQQVLSGVEMTPRLPSSYGGALAANLDGQVVGMSVWSEEGNAYIILPAERILDGIQAITATAPSGGTTGKTQAETPPGSTEESSHA